MVEFISREEFESQLAALRNRVLSQNVLLRHLEEIERELLARVGALETERDDVLARPTTTAAEDNVDGPLDHKWKVGDLAHVVQLRHDDGRDHVILAAFLRADDAVVAMDTLLASRHPNNCDLAPLGVTTGTVKRVDVLKNAVVELDSFLIV